jgi:hypothetical protein
MPHMQLSEIVETSAAVAATRARTAKIEAIAGALRRMAPGELAAGAAFLASRASAGWVWAGRRCASFRHPRPRPR